MKELIKPNHAEARYAEDQTVVTAFAACGIDRSCESRNRCNSSNESDAEVMDEILF